MVKPDATKNGTVVEQGSLTGSTAGTIWDFNNGLQGWTVSNPTFVVITQYLRS